MGLSVWSWHVAYPCACVPPWVLQLPPRVQSSHMFTRLIGDSELPAGVSVLCERLSVYISALPLTVDQSRVYPPSPKDSWDRLQPPTLNRLSVRTWINQRCTFRGAVLQHYFSSTACLQIMCRSFLIKGFQRPGIPSHQQSKLFQWKVNKGEKGLSL